MLLTVPAIDRHRGGSGGGGGGGGGEFDAAATAAAAAATSTKQNNGKARNSSSGASAERPLHELSGVHALVAPRQAYAQARMRSMPEPEPGIHCTA